MARVTDITNQWGKKGGPDPQRTDLWQVDMSFVIDGINANASVTPKLPQIPRYFATAISIPEQKVRAEQITRDSRVYNVPGKDEPLDPVKISFVMDDGGKVAKGEADAAQSTIYTILDVWRSVVRAGRGAVGSEASIDLGANYRIDYAFPVYIYLLKGQSLPAASTASSVTRMRSSSPTFESTFEGGFASGDLESAVSVSSAPTFEDALRRGAGLDVSGVYQLENCWLAGFKMSDLAYDRSAVLTVEATLYADNILQIRRKDGVPSFL